MEPLTEAQRTYNIAADAIDILERRIAKAVTVLSNWEKTSDIEDALAVLRGEN